jgi:hypothetical protein
MFRRISCMAVANLNRDHPVPQIETKIEELSPPEIEKDNFRTAVASMLDAASHYETWRTKGLKIRGGLMLVLGSVEFETA